MNGNVLAGFATGTFEAIGPLMLSHGSTTITAAASSVAGSTLMLSSPSLTRNPGGAVDFEGSNAPLGSRSNQIVFSTAPALSGSGSNGILPYAIVSFNSTTTPSNFATYSPTFGITAFTNYVTSLANAGPGDNVSSLGMKSWRVASAPR